MRPEVRGAARQRANGDISIHHAINDLAQRAIAAAVHDHIEAIIRRLARKLSRLTAVHLVAHSDLPPMRLEHLQWLRKIDAAASRAWIRNEARAYNSIYHRLRLPPQQTLCPALKHKGRLPAFSEIGR
jgi:hypothetical protein